MKTKHLLGLILIALFFASCSSKQISVPILEYEENNVKLEPFKRSEYVVLGTVEGTGCASRLFVSTSSKGSASGKAQNLAIKDAVAKFKGADAIITPIYEEESSSIPLIYYKICVKVTGKAIAIKTDDELK